MSDKKNLGHNSKKDFLKSPVEHIDITSFDARKIIASNSIVELLPSGIYGTTPVRRLWTCTLLRVKHSTSTMQKEKCLALHP